VPAPIQAPAAGGRPAPAAAPRCGAAPEGPRRGLGDGGTRAGWRGGPDSDAARRGPGEKPEATAAAADTLPSLARLWPISIHLGENEVWIDYKTGWGLARSIYRSKF
jgi:hypothetical protein